MIKVKRQRCKYVMLIVMNNRRIRIIVGVIICFTLSFVSVGNVFAASREKMDPVNDNRFLIPNCYKESPVVEDEGVDTERTITTYVCPNYIDLKVCHRTENGWFGTTRDKYYLINLNSRCEYDNATIPEPSGGSWAQDKDYFICKTTVFKSGVDDPGILPHEENCYSNYHYIPISEYHKDEGPGGGTTEVPKNVFDPQEEKDAQWVKDNCSRTGRQFNKDGWIGEYYDCTAFRDGDTAVREDKTACLVASYGVDNEEEVFCDATADRIASAEGSFTMGVRTLLKSECEDHSTIGWFVCPGLDIVNKAIDVLVSWVLLPMIRWQLIV